MPALLATAFSFGVAVTVLAWAAFSEFETTSLGSFIVKHVQIAPLIVDLAVGRVPIAWKDVSSPLVNYVLYIAVAGIYSVSAGRSPYSSLDFKGGETAAAVFVCLGFILIGFCALKLLSDARDRGSKTHSARRRASDAAAAPTPVVVV